MHGWMEERKEKEAVSHGGCLRVEHGIMGGESEQEAGREGGRTERRRDPERRTERRETEERTDVELLCWLQPLSSSKSSS